MTPRIITRQEFRQRVGGISKATERRQRLRDPAYPKIVKISPGRTGIYEEDCDRLIARVVGRDQQGGKGSR
jgi:hypothetical protein